ncbi:MAG: hypothetical protein IJP86_05195 [Synergistaceae bacterium]|nr:hypothetical protein [Synergistaceae bacterium]
MSEYTAGSWKYRREDDGTFTVYPAWYKKVILARVPALGGAAEPNARLIACAPEMHNALAGANEALRATEAFMSGKGLETEALREIVRRIDGLLDRIDGLEEQE